MKWIIILLVGFLFLFCCCMARAAASTDRKVAELFWNTVRRADRQL